LPIFIGLETSYLTTIDASVNLCYKMTRIHSDQLKHLSDCVSYRT